MFSAASLMWPSLFTSLFLSLLLYIPPQVHVLYRILLQDDDWLHATGTLGFLILSFCAISMNVVGE